jgi:hypothetical protein
MFSVRALLVLALLIAAAIIVSATSFVVFPKANQLRSPDGRFVIQNENRDAAPSDMVGTFHSLWLVESATQRSRKLCDYVGLAAVAWSDSGSLIITQYVGKQTSRALVFPNAVSDDPILLDKSTLTRLVPVELRPTLRENDHIFVEGARVDADTLYLRVWGRGLHDPQGFHWDCRYGLNDGAIACTQSTNAFHP